MLDTIAMAEQLSGEYRSAFERADIYSFTAKKTEEYIDEKMMELYNLLIKAEKNNQPIEEVIGNDIELYCKNFFVEEKKRYTLKEALDSLFAIMCGLLIYTLLQLLLEEKQSNLLPFVAGFAAGGVVEVLAKYWLQPVVFKNKKIKPIVYYFSILGAFLGCFIGMLILSYKYNVTIQTWWLFGISAIYVLVYFVIRSIWRYKKYGSIFGHSSEEKMNKEFKKDFNKELQEKTMTKAVAQAMASRFRRIRKRKQKRGREYTFEDFAQLIRKEEKITKRGNWVFIIITALMVVVPGINIMVEETLFDGFIFILIMGVFEYFICRLVVKSNIDSMKTQLSLIEECEQSNIDILEYVEGNTKKFE